MRHRKCAPCLLMAVLFVLISIQSFAIDLYWNPVAGPGSDNRFSNKINWETSPGANDGSSLGSGPSSTDDVYFYAASDISSISLLGGSCHSFNVTAPNPASFSFTNVLSNFWGNLNCPNGNASFNLLGNSQYLNGTGSQFINMGTSAVKITNGYLIFTNNGSTTIPGTYTLTGPFNTSVGISIQNQNFYSGGNQITSLTLGIGGGATKTVDLTNSKVYITTSVSNNSVLVFDAPNSTTTYLFTGTHFIVTSTTAYILSVGMAPGVVVSADSLTLNTPAPTADAMNYSTPGGAPSVMNLNAMVLNTGNLSINGNNTFNVASLVFKKPCIIRAGTASSNNTINAGAITEAPACSGQSGIISNNPFYLNATAAPLTTTSLAYYGVVFGGSGFTASKNNDLGFNNGSISWGAATPGKTFWWVGGTGNWDDPTKWSITGSAGSGGTPQSASGCLPTTQDDVIFDAASFTAANQNVSVVNGFCKNISWTGSNLGNLKGATSNSGGTIGSLYINGSSDFTGARSVDRANLTYIGSGTHSITSGNYFAYNVQYIQFMGSGNYTLADDFITQNSIMYQYAGGLNTSGHKMDLYQFATITYFGSRTLDISNSEIRIKTVAHFYTSYLTSMNAANSNIVFYNTGGGTLNVQRTNGAATYLNPVNFNNVSYTGAAGTGTLATVGSAGDFTLNFNDVSFAGNGVIGTNFLTGLVHTVNNYNLTSGATYTFSAATGAVPTFNVSGGINHVLTGCANLVRIQSSVAGTRAIINKAATPFTVNGAYVIDINSAGTTMNVTGGVDGGNNLNVTTSAGAGRTMYWVGGTGNWNQGSHWSIGTGDPAVTNPMGCIPRIIDDVVFNDKSFSNTGDTVKLTTDANCRNMLWTADAGSYAPTIRPTIANLNLNVYGSLELAKGMKPSSLSGIVVNMWGNSNHTINMNGVDNYYGPNSVANIYFRGGGRYELLDSLRGVGIFLIKGNFVTNGKKITATGWSLNVTGTNAADISNSYIELRGGGGGSSHSGPANWNASGSTIYMSAAGPYNISNTAPINFGSIISNGGGAIGNTANQKVTYKNISFINQGLSPVTSRLSGLMDIDTLSYTPSSMNLLTPCATCLYTIKDTIIGYGTPCLPLYIRSNTAGTPAVLKSSRCNFDLNFVNLQNITASNNCTAAQNKVIGADEGGNSNWTFTSASSLPGLPADTSVFCKDLPYMQEASGFGNIPGMTYTWNTGATDKTISVNTSNTYTVVVNYGPSCNGSDSRTITVVSNPPKTIPLSYAQPSTLYCTTNNYIYYEGNLASSTNGKSILALGLNGNSISPSSITVNNEGNLTGGSGSFSNTGNGYYESTDFAKTIRISKRLHSVIAPGTYTANGGVIVRVYYEDADLANIATDAWPDGLNVSTQGWFKHTNNNAAGVVSSMTPGYLPGATDISPIASGTEGGVKYVEFKVTNFSTFGYYAKTTPFTLPVTLVSFNAASENCKVKLNWKTAEEISFNRFEIERSNDGVSYNTISTVNASGNNSTYSYTDNTPKEGKNIYRLKMIDIDGKYKYSALKLVTFSCNGNKSILIYPNPASDNINISISGYTKQVSGKLYNAIGQLQKTSVLVNGTNNIPANGLANGVYNLVIIDENGNNTCHKVIVQH